MLECLSHCTCMGDKNTIYDAFPPPPHTGVHTYVRSNAGGEGRITSKGHGMYMEGTY